LGLHLCCHLAGYKFEAGMHLGDLFGCHDRPTCTAGTVGYSASMLIKYWMLQLQLCGL